MKDRRTRKGRRRTRSGRGSLEVKLEKALQTNTAAEKDQSVQGVVDETSETVSPASSKKLDRKMDSSL